MTAVQTTTTINNNNNGWETNGARPCSFLIQIVWQWQCQHRAQNKWNLKSECVMAQDGTTRSHNNNKLYLYRQPQQWNKQVKQRSSNRFINCCRCSCSCCKAMIESINHDHHDRLMKQNTNQRFEFQCDMLWCKCQHPSVPKRCWRCCRCWHMKKLSVLLLFQCCSMMPWTSNPVFCYWLLLFCCHGVVTQRIATFEWYSTVLYCTYR